MTVFVWTFGITFVIALACSLFLVALANSMATSNEGRITGKGLLVLPVASGIAALIVALCVTGIWSLVGGVT